MSLNAEEFVNLMSKIHKEAKAFSLGRIDPSYSSGRPCIVFDGETTPSAKSYPYLSSYSPAKNDRVILANIAGSVVILGRVI